MAYSDTIMFSRSAVVTQCSSSERKGPSGAQLDMCFVSGYPDHFVRGLSDTFVFVMRPSTKLNEGKALKSETLFNRVVLVALKSGRNELSFLFSPNE